MEKEFKEYLKEVKNYFANIPLEEQAFAHDLLGWESITEMKYKMNEDINYVIASLGNDIEVVMALLNKISDFEKTHPYSKWKEEQQEEQERIKEEIRKQSQNQAQLQNQSPQDTKKSRAR